MTREGLFILGALAALIAMLGTAAAQPVPDYGYQWATITHAGNRAANAQEAPSLFGARSPGRVDYEFRIATTEVTVAQWFDFVQAYSPFYADRSDPSFTGLDIYPTSLDPNRPAGFRIITGHENKPTTMSWLFAARYANWLHNDKATSPNAFETGAYDLRGLPDSPAFYPERLPGARFWIPSLDEWTKAVYFDPNRYGQGEAGYWWYPLGSNEIGVPGPPGVGQTGAGYFGVGSITLDVGSYPNSRTPWGLLDASGGVQEWTDSGPGSDPERWFERYVRGSEAGMSVPAETEFLSLYWLHAGRFSFSNGPGLRMASVVPTPSVFTVFVGGIAIAVRRRR